MSLTERKTVLYASKPERLVASRFPVGFVRIFAEKTNTGAIFLGHSQRVSAQVGNEAGEPIYPGQFLDLTRVDLYDIWIDAAVDTDGVHWRASLNPTTATPQPASWSDQDRGLASRDIRIPTVLAEGQLPVLEAAQYTVPTGYNAIVTLIQANNNGSTTETVVFSIRPGSSSREFIRAVLLADETAEWNGDMPLNEGDVIRGKTTSATTVDYTIHGYLVPL